MFWFTENQGEVLLAFFAVGSLFAAQIFGFLVVAGHKSYRWMQIIFLIFFLIFIIVLNAMATSGDLYLLCFFTLMIGFFLTLLIVQEFQQLDPARDDGGVPLALTLFGAYGALLCFWADKSHYWNRDDPYWSYVNIGVAGLFVLVGCLCSIAHKVGCKCCKCCCGMCHRCCGSQEGEEPSDSDSDWEWPLYPEIR